VATNYCLVDHYASTATSAANGTNRYWPLIMVGGVNADCSQTALLGSRNFHYQELNFCSREQICHRTVAVRKNYEIKTQA